MTLALKFPVENWALILPRDKTKYSVNESTCCSCSKLQALPGFIYIKLWIFINFNIIWDKPKPVTSLPVRVNWKNKINAVFEVLIMM